MCFCKQDGAYLCLLDQYVPRSPMDIPWISHNETRLIGDGDTMDHLGHDDQHSHKFTVAHPTSLPSNHPSNHKLLIFVAL